MKKNLVRKIEIPEGTTVNFHDEILVAKGKEGENKKALKLGNVKLEIKGNEIILSSVNGTKTEKKLMNTNAAHIKNLIHGANQKFEYELKVCFGHFPMTVKQEGKKVIIKNFLGEKVNREVEILDGAQVEINKEKIIVKSTDKEIAGQTAANFETATKIRGRDKRIFQDGIYIIKKNNKEI